LVQPKHPPDEGIQNAQKYAMGHLSEEVYGNKIMEVYKKTLSI
jgi:hypothetical protein